MSIIEKLEITPLEEKEIPQDDCPNCYEHITAETFDFMEVRNKEKIFNDMLEALIMQYELITNWHNKSYNSSDVSNINDCVKNSIEKATGKSWDEIKELI